MFTITAAVKTIRDNSHLIEDAIEELTKNDLLVGVPATKAGRNEPPINNAALAYIHTFGSPTQNIPPRPFLDPGIANAQSDINARLQAAGESAFSGNQAGVRKNLEAAGIVASTAVRLKINQGPFAPLKPATLAARRRRGRTGTKPLIDTGQLRNSITYVVRRHS